MAPGGEPVTELILVDLETTLSTIVSGDDYYTDVNRVQRIDGRPVDLRVFPQILLVPLEVSFDGARVSGVWSGVMRVSITCILKERTDPVKAIHRFIRDIHKAVTIDIQRDGNALDTHVERVEPFYPTEETDAMCGADITLAIRYRALESDLNTPT